MNIETRLALVILAVADLPRARSFYQGAFGWTLAVDEAVYVGERLGQEAVGLAADLMRRPVIDPESLRPPADVDAERLP